jgi:PAS domain S-box-containing protein
MTVEPIERGHERAQDTAPGTSVEADPARLSALTEQLFDLLVETVHDYAIFVLDPRGRVTTWNPGAERIKGYATQEILGKHVSRFYAQDEVLGGACERDLDAAARDGRFEDEGWRVRKDGTRFWANVVITALRSADGALAGFAKVTRDLTSRRVVEEERLARARAEEASRANDASIAREREAKRASDEARRIAEEAQSALATTLRSIGDAVIATSVQGHVTMMNPVAEGLTGWSEDDARGVPFADVFGAIDEHSRERVTSPVDRVLHEGVVVSVSDHTLLVSRAGAETPIDASGAPIRDEHGAIRGVVLVFRSASEEKQALLRRAYLADVTTALASSLDYRTTLRSVARLAVPTLADWCRIDLIEDGTSVPTEIAVAHTDVEKVRVIREWAREHPPGSGQRRGIAKVLRTGEPELYADITDTVLVAVATNDEHLRLLRQLGLRSAIIAPVTAGGVVLGAITLAFAESGRRYRPDDVVFVEDLGRRAGLAIENARLFQAAHDARRAADDANRAKDEFLARISHELRTPLNAILGWAQLMTSPRLEAAKHTRGVETIVRNAQAMARLIEDLLDVSRITSGKLRIELEPVELVPVIDAAIDAVRPAADAKQIRIERSVDTGRHVVRGDGTRLQQIAWNLLSNAVKFTPSGGRVDVSVRVVGTAVEIAVSDTGKGIDPQFVPLLFQPFRQADTGKARGGAGLGLGLSIAKQLVELHGGYIAVRSEGLGKGATFTVHLPSAASIVRDERSAMTEAPRNQPSGELGGRHVLVVDDEADARSLIETVLEQSGARVTTASSVEEALAAFEREPPDVLVSDIGMPERDGYDLIREIRTMPASRGGDVPALALTAYARVEDRMRATSAGYESHLAKPVDPATLALMVSMLAKTRATPPSVDAASAAGT